MTAMSHATAPPLPARRGDRRAAAHLRDRADHFLTVVDLFATKAILPSLVKAYGVSPAAMGFAVSASTIGMAAAGSPSRSSAGRIDRRQGIVASLALLSIPTALLATAPDLATFTALQVAQGGLHVGRLHPDLGLPGGQCSASDAGSALAAYITGNVASNLVGRLISAGGGGPLGPGRQLLPVRALEPERRGAGLPPSTGPRPWRRRSGMGSPLAVWAEHLRNAPLRRGFAIGFLILFAFSSGTFTYVNFVLAQAVRRQPDGVRLRLLRLPAFHRHDARGRPRGQAASARGRPGALGIAGAGLPLLLSPSLVAVLAGLVLVGAGAALRASRRPASSGEPPPTAARPAARLPRLPLYGGLVDTVLGQVFDRFGWAACVAGVGQHCSRPLGRPT